MNIVLKIFLLSISCLSIISCEKESSSRLVGTWKMTDIHSDDGIAAKSYLPDPTPDSLLLTYIFHGAEYNVLLNFEDDPNQYTRSGQYKHIETSDNQGVLTTTEIHQFENSNGNWTITNSTLLLEIENGNLGHEEEYEILELSESQLQLKEFYDTYMVGLSYPFPVHIQATVYLTFEKQ